MPLKREFLQAKQHLFVRPLCGARWDQLPSNTEGMLRHKTLLWAMPSRMIKLDSSSIHTDERHRYEKIDFGTVPKYPELRPPGCQNFTGNLMRVTIPTTSAISALPA